MKNLFVTFILLLTLFSFSKEKIVISEFTSKILTPQILKSITNSFIDKFQEESGEFFTIINSDFLTKELEKKMNTKTIYTKKSIDSLIYDIAKSDLILSGDIKKINNRFEIYLKIYNIQNGKIIASCTDKILQSKSFLPFYIEKSIPLLIQSFETNYNFTINTDKMTGKMIKISSGFLYSNSNQEYIKGFYIDEHEVTNFMYKQFVEATKYVTDCEKKGSGWIFRDNKWQKIKGVSWKTPQGKYSNINNLLNHPVIYISYNDANAYSKWASKRLPTEKEWAYIAKGKTTNLFPYGNIYDEFRGNYNSGDNGSTTKVKSFKPEYNNLYDLSGNVMEWTSTPYIYNKKQYFIIKGGSWISIPEKTLIDNKNFQPKDSAFPYLGFRCAKDKK